jgi:hypothetical protein
MSFPKKGTSFPKSGDPNTSNGEGGSLDGMIKFALEIASALERKLKDKELRSRDPRI